MKWLPGRLGVRQAHQVPIRLLKSFCEKMFKNFVSICWPFFQFYIVPVMRLFSPLFLEREFFWCVSMPIPERERNVNNSSDGFLAMKVFGLMKRADWFQISFRKYCIKGGGCCSAEELLNISVFDLCQYQYIGIFSFNK